MKNHSTYEHDVDGGMSFVRVLKTTVKQNTRQISRRLLSVFLRNHSLDTSISISFSHHFPRIDNITRDGSSPLMGDNPETYVLSSHHQTSQIHHDDWTTLSRNLRGAHHVKEYWSFLLFNLIFILWSRSSFSLRTLFMIKRIRVNTWDSKMTRYNSSPSSREISEGRHYVTQVIQRRQLLLNTLRVYPS